MTDEGNRTCELYVQALARGEQQTDVVRELAELFDVQRPAIWKRLRAGGLIEPYAPRQTNGKGRPIGDGKPGYTAQRRSGRADRQALFASSTPNPVHRDPCPRCGIRGDLDCAHSRNRLGTVL